MLTARPRAAPAVIRPGSAERDRPAKAPVVPGRRTRSGTSRPRPPLVVRLPALLLTLLGAVPAVYLALRAADGGPGMVDLVLRPRTAEIAFTVLLAGAVAASSALVAVPLAWLTPRSDLPGRRFWATAALPLVIPSYVGALALVAALGPRGLVQGWLEPFGTARLPSIYGRWGSWLALTPFTYPHVLPSVRAGLHGLDLGVAEAARGLAATPAGAIRRVTAPPARPGALAGAALVMPTSLEELPITRPLGPTGCDTLATRIRRPATDAASGEAAAPALPLILLSAAPTLLLAARDRTAGA